MKTIRSVFIRGLGAAAVLAAVAFCSLNAQAEVVFGNLGVVEAAPVATESTEAGAQEPAAVNWLTQGFTLDASSQLAVASVTLGLIGPNPGTIPLSVALFSTDGEGLSSTTLSPSAMTDVDDADAFKFAVEAATLQANATAAVAPGGGSLPLAAGLRSSSEIQAVTGYAYTRTLVSYAQATDPTAANGVATDDDSRPSADDAAVTMEAVPEPSSVVIAGFGILGVAMLHCRRRRN